MTIDEIGVQFHWNYFTHKYHVMLGSHTKTITDFMDSIARTFCHFFSTRDHWLNEECANGHNVSMQCHPPHECSYRGMCSATLRRKSAVKIDYSWRSVSEPIFKLEFHLQIILHAVACVRGALVFASTAQRITVLICKK